MSKTLNRLDGEVVDVMLGAGLAHGRTPTRLPAGGVSRERIAAVEAVLMILSAAPAIEPPTDLVQRTLGRIAAQSFSCRAVVAGAPASADIGPLA